MTNQKSDFYIGSGYLDALQDFSGEIWSVYCLKDFFHLIWLFQAKKLFPWCYSGCVCLYLVIKLLVSLAYWLFPATIVLFLVIYLLATVFEAMSETQVPPMVENSIPKTILRTKIKLNGSNYLLWAHSVYSLALKTNWLTSKIHLLLLQILLMWPGLLEIILWWHDFSTA